METIIDSKQYEKLDSVETRQNSESDSAGRKKEQEIGLSKTS